MLKVVPSPLVLRGSNARTASTPTRGAVPSTLRRAASAPAIPVPCGCGAPLPAEPLAATASKLCTIAPARSSCEASMPESITATSTRLPVASRCASVRLNPLRRVLVGIHLRKLILRQRKQVVRLRAGDLGLARDTADHIGDAGAAVDPPAEQPAPGETEGLRLHAGHRVTRGDRIELTFRDARRDVEDNLIGHERGTGRRQIEALARDRRGLGTAAALGALASASCSAA